MKNCSFFIIVILVLGLVVVAQYREIQSLKVEIALAELRVELQSAQVITTDTDPNKR